MDNEQLESQSTPLPPSEASHYRALAARANYLALDRPDVQYSVKEVARRMAAPTARDWALLKRLARYLIGAPRLVINFDWQPVPCMLDVCVDSDWAGCKSTCRSTSGGVVLHGTHAVKSWSTTQAVVALSSGEAELYSLTKGAAQALGMISLARDLGQHVGAEVHCDASAAIGIVSREGLGKLRHLRVQYLWIQDRVKSGDVHVAKIAGRDNPADLLTKYLPAADMQRHLECLECEVLRDRADVAPKLQMLTSGQDVWIRDGHKLIREHIRPRDTLFTPIRVEGSPPAKTLSDVRITRGKFIDTQEEFEVIDSWRTRRTAHRSLGQRWTGTTSFVAKTEVVR